MSKASEEALGHLHGLLAQAFAGIVRDGITVLNRDGQEVTLTAPAAYLKEVREFLKDNHTSALPSKNKPLQELAEVLPFPAPGEGEGFKVG